MTKIKYAFETQLWEDADFTICYITEQHRQKDSELARLPGDEQVYNMQTQGNGARIKRLKKMCPSPEKLRLKVGAVVIFTRNDTSLGVVNGTFGKVVGYDLNTIIPVVQLACGRTVLVTWETLASITQLPLKPAWALTIHKAQGMSPDRVICLDVS